tara:strand:- start:463 stop:672 length:210 start_codon:yes stop_codon:yes gene_type:complete
MDELTKTLLPKFNKWNSERAFLYQGLYRVKIKDWVWGELGETESLITITRVSNELFDELMAKHYGFNNE